MAQIVLVHGIAQEQYSADGLEAVWLPSLAGGVRLAGDADLADRLWRSARPGSIEARMAFYGDLFLKPGSQGSAEGLPEAGGEFDLGQQLAGEWLNRAAERAETSADRAEAARAVAALNAGPDDGEQGGARRQHVAARLARLRWFAPHGIAFAQRFVNRSLSQVTRYFTDDSLRQAAIERVLALCGPETVAIIGHSLGSVVAFEAVHQLTEPLPLLLTLGSPLGVRTVVYDRIRPQPPSVPEAVRAWVNIAATGDIVAAEPDIAEGFGRDTRLSSNILVENGASPHEATHYLAKRQTGAALKSAVEAWTGE